MTSIGQRINWLKKKYFQRKYIRYKGVILPPNHMRLMGDKFFRNSYYLNSSLREGERFKNQLKVNGNTEVLEIGCSSGRSLIGLIEKVGSVKRYVGIDANRNNIEWCKNYIGKYHKFCEFHYIDLWNELFNTQGKILIDENFRIEFEDNSFDVIYLQSVLSNVIDKDIRFFAPEYFRLLKPGGTLFLTGFIEENVPPMTENPENYVMKCTYPKQVVRFEKNYFLKMFTDAGFVIEKYEQGTEEDYQSAVYLKKL